MTIDDGELSVRKYPCLCSECQQKDFENCAHKDSLGSYSLPTVVDLSSRKAVKFGSGNTGKDDIDFEVSDNEWKEEEEEEEGEEDNWEESESVQMIRESDLVVLRSGDEFSPILSAQGN